MYMSNITLNFNFAEFHLSIIILLILMVIFLRNPIHALLCFIFGVINIITIFITFEAEFVAIVLFLVYVGAIAVLFLALIMFLNLSYLFYNEIENKSTSISFFEKILYLLVLFSFFFGFYNHIFNFYIITPQISVIFTNFSQIYLLSYIMYSNLYIFIVVSGLLLLLTTIITMIYTTLPKVISYNYIRNMVHIKTVIHDINNS
jgi:NADH-quinone oxidoreductase subunit J